MRLAWAGAFLLSCAWVWGLPALGPERPWLSMAAILSGALCYAVGMRSALTLTAPRSTWVLGAAAALIAWLTPWPYRAAPLLVTLAAVVAALEGRQARSHFAGGLLMGAVVASVQALLLPALLWVWADWHSIPQLAPLLVCVTRMLGVPAAADEGALFVGGFDHPLVLTIAPERFGYLFIMPLAVGGIVHLVLAGRRWWYVVYFLCAAAAYGVVRFLFVGILHATLRQQSRVPLEWDATCLIVTFLPFGLVMSSIGGRGQSLIMWSVRPRSGSDRRLVIAGTVLAAAATFGLAHGWAYQDPGAPKVGRVLIDETHSRWEDTTRPMDTEWYGELSTYNYYNLSQHLGRYFEVRANQHAPLNDQTLSACDVLVLKTPTKWFDDREVEAIRAYVARGGGLWLIGDHTNVFGMGTYLNRVARQFGLRFRYDSVYEIGTGKLNLYRRPPVLPHPIVTHVPEFLFATSCTISGGLGCQRVMTSPGLRVVDHDYSQRSFFPDKSAIQSRSVRAWFGPFIQCAARAYGKGRVVALADSTQFSNFFVYLDGRPELALATVDWLNHSNARGTRRWGAGAAGLACMCGLLALLRRRARAPAWAIAAIVTAACLGAAAGLRLTDALNRSHVRLPAPRVEIPSVAFDLKNSRIFLPIRHLVGPSEQWDDGLTFWVWAQRVGLVPSHHANLESACQTGKSVVIANPERPLAPRDAARLQAYTEEGGYLLLLTGRRPTHSTAPAGRRSTRYPNIPPDSPRGISQREAAVNEILEPFGLKVDLASALVAQPILADNSRPVCDSFCAGSVSGGHSLLQISGEHTVLAERAVGQGRVLVFTDWYLLTTPSMGSTGTRPSPEQKRVYALVYKLLEMLPGARSVAPGEG